MFHLASSLYTQYTKREQYNVLILGLDNAGKTTFLEHIKLLYPTSTETKAKNTDKEPKTLTIDILKNKKILPTVGQNTTTIKFESSSESETTNTASASNNQFNNINLKFWDLGGQKSLRSMWSRYFRSCHGIIFIIDSTDTERFQECYETLMEIAHDELWFVDSNNNNLLNVPILMLANKQDLPQAVDLVSLKTGVFIQVVSELEATDLKLLPVSVLNNQGLTESLEWLVSRLIYNKANKMPEYK
ncbi:P-loop containing nucleoside triphosphate hydrolase protein [Hyphopichia burtonii NRRL Y-1933]|uniref:p-loop containing nucleoside triphosphate hydrolase protein n=1 Tax=Hyphopichia burtonii NRRL Y-1933 TaxID=984485 RepID=A0A1E4RDU1_9ASCO|nr:P-loop containing nucleoside triphosphate hydrolase protein [Hyphopichia burtonii NRRL Y-1933]ODV65403.1 P-loop containing nucleoside triphosphate hydrolase protein [Hyphopichia burtonii NRRL Y-1933]